MKKSIILIISSLFLTSVFAQNEDNSNLKDTLDLNEVKYAEYPGGILALILFIEENTIYPKSAKQKKVKGKVILKFTIDTSGYVNNIIAIKEIQNCPECTQECIRVLKSTPKWIPGTYKNNPIDSNYTLPFNFKKTSRIKRK